MDALKNLDFLFLAMPGEVSKYIKRTVVLNPGQFCPPRGHMAMSEDMFYCYNWGRKGVCYWLPVGGGQGGC